KPDFLLVEFFPAALAADGPAEQQFAKIVPRLSAADVDRLAPYCDSPASLRRDWAASRASSGDSHRRSLMSHLQPGWLAWQHRLTFQWDQMDGFGFTPYPHEVMPPGARETQRETVRESYAPVLADYRVGATSDRAIRDLVARCRAEGIPVAFYLMPESPRFRSWYTDDTRAQVVAYCNMLTRELGVPIFDAAEGFAEGEFSNGHHLLQHGQARVRLRLAAEHLLPWVRLSPR